MAGLIKIFGCLVFAALIWWGIGQLAGHQTVIVIGGIGLSLSIILASVGFLYSWGSVALK